MNNKFKAFCNRCNTITNHTTKCEHSVDETVEYEHDEGIEHHHISTAYYQIVECNGCESISYRSVDLFSSFIEIENGKPKITNNKTFETYYPERLKDLLTEKRITGLPMLLKKAYREIIDGFNNDQSILCAAGLRAIVEGICAHYSIKGKYLKDKIDGLSGNSLISKELAESLKIHKFLGDYALHRLDIPDKQELRAAIHLIELTLETLFGVPEHHKELKKSVTKRTAPKKK